MRRSSIARTMQSLASMRVWQARPCSVSAVLMPHSCGHHPLLHNGALDRQPLFALTSLRHYSANTLEPIGGFDRLRALPDDVPADLHVPVPSFCAGCGIKLQNVDEDAPGFYQLPRKLIDYHLAKRARALTQEQQGMDIDEQAEAMLDEQLEHWQLVRDRINAGLPLPETGPAPEAAHQAEDEWGLQEAVQEEVDEEAPVVICTRCYALRHYGQLRSELAESHLPEFHLGPKVGRKIGFTRHRRAVLLCVVDATDFDGSLPRQALQQVLSTATAVAASSKQSSGSQADGVLDVPLGFRFVLAVNKIDLLPGNYSPARLVNWVRSRAKQGGLPSPDAVPLLSSTKGKGALDLHGLLKKMLGPRGDVWVIGAQNAGKSSLINSLRRCAKLPQSHDLTTAVVPGTTLGMLRVDKVFLGQGKLYDTPGVPHPYQLTSRLSLDEVKLVLPRSRLRPRTFRIGVGQSVLMGGLARVDVTACPHATMYVTVWASSDVSLWMGKSENAEERRVGHMGKELVPPFAPDPSQPIEALEPTDVPVAGDTWTASSTDVAIAGLGWISVGVKGNAGVRVWAPPGIAITVRKAMLPDYAKEFERPGFRRANPRALKAAAEARGAEKTGGKGPPRTDETATLGKGGEHEEGKGRGRKRRAVPVV